MTQTTQTTLRADTVLALYVRKQAGEQPKALATEAGVTVQKLMAEFKKLARELGEQAQADEAVIEGQEEEETTEATEETLLGVPTVNEVEQPVAVVEEEQEEEEEQVEEPAQPEPTADAEVLPTSQEIEAASTTAATPATPKAKKKRKASKASKLAARLGAEKVAELGRRWAAGEKLSKLCLEAKELDEEAQHANQMFWVLTEAGYKDGRATKKGAGEEE